MLLKQLIFSTNPTILKTTVNFLSQFIHFILHFNTFALAVLFSSIRRLQTTHIKALGTVGGVDNGTGQHGVQLRDSYKVVVLVMMM